MIDFGDVGYLSVSEASIGNTTRIATIGGSKQRPAVGDGIIEKRSAFGLQSEMEVENNN